MSERVTVIMCTPTYDGEEAKSFPLEVWPCDEDDEGLKARMDELKESDAFSHYGWSTSEVEMVSGS